MANSRPVSIHERDPALLFRSQKLRVFYKACQCMGVSDCVAWRESILLRVIDTWQQFFSNTMKSSLLSTKIHHRFRRVPSGIERDSYYHEVSNANQSDLNVLNLLTQYSHPLAKHQCFVLLFCANFTKKTVISPGHAPSPFKNEASSGKTEKGSS